MFHKVYYQGVLSALEEERGAPEIDDRQRIQYVLMAYAELITSVPVDDDKLVEE